MIWTKTCKKCGKLFDYKECPYCRKKEEEDEKKKNG